MASVTWIGSSGDWSDAANWDSGSVPGVGDDVSLQDSGYYIVSASSAIHVASIIFQNFSGSLDLSGSGVRDIVSHDLMNSGNLVVDGDDQSGGTTLRIGGTLTNNDTLTLGSNFGTLTGSVIVRTTHLQNLNTINLYGGADQGTRAVLDVTGDAAPESLTGTYYLSGDANLEFAGGEINNISEGCSLTLDGARAHVSDTASPGTNSALADLTSNNGWLTLENGSSLYNIQSDFQNLGALDVAGGSKFTTADGVNLLNTDILEIERGGAVKVSGTLTNTNTIFIDGDGATPTVLDVGHLVNSYAINLSAENGTPPQQAAILRDLGDAAPSTLQGEVTLSVTGNSLIEFASGSIASIGQDATLKIDGSQARIADADALGSNSALSDLVSNAGTLILADGAVLKSIGATFTNSGTFRILDHTSISTAPGVGFVNSGALEVDTDGSIIPYSGSSLDIGGALTNTGSLEIQNGYNSYNSSPTIVTVHGLAAIGSISIQGNTNYSQNDLAELNDIGGVAPDTLSAGVSISLAGDALLQFASGGITSIAKNAWLSLDGTQARVADSDLLTINSALTGLAGNAGTLVLADGADLHNESVAFDNSGTFSILNSTAVLTDSGVDFTNSGTLNVDTAYADSGSTLDVGGTFYNSGTLAVGNANDTGGMTEVIANNFVNTGTIDLATALGSSAQVWVNDDGVASSVLSAGEHFNLAGNALLEFSKGKIKTIAANASISLSGPNAFIADAADPNENSVLLQLSTNAGYFTLSNGASFEAQASFTNSGKLSLAQQASFYVAQDLSNTGTLSLMRQASFHVAQDLTNTGTLNFDSNADLNGAGGSVINVGGTLTNSGSMSVGYAILPMSGDVTLTTTHLVNTGSIGIGGAAYQTTLDVLDDAAPTTLAAGVGIGLSGDALLEYASGSIESIAKGASLSMSGVQARIADASDTTTDSALSGFVSNAGTFSLSGGAVVANGTNDFLNSGYLSVAFGIPNAASAFDVGGTLTNSGTIDISDYNGGGINAAGLANSGTITIQGGNSLLHLTGDVTNTGTVNIGTYTFHDLLSAAGNYTQSGGLTELDYGTLSASEVIVSGGTLDGIGQIDGFVSVRGGTFVSGFLKYFTAADIGVTGGFAVQSGGTVAEVLVADSGQSSEIQVTRGVHLYGGVLDLNVSDPSALHVGETFTIMSFADGKLNGQFSEIVDGKYTGSGTSVDIGKGLTLDVLYNNSAGNIQVQVVATPAAAAHDLIADNAQHALLTDDAILALDTHGMSWHHGGHALHFEHAPIYDNAPII
ncbi:MAG TPA: hypothetical protein VIJ62_12310 [Rhizomicrobium sp.]